jgi:hypothetical protein
MPRRKLDGAGIVLPRLGGQLLALVGRSAQVVRHGQYLREAWVVLLREEGNQAVKRAQRLVQLLVWGTRFIA